MFSNRCRTVSGATFRRRLGQRAPARTHAALVAVHQARQSIAEAMERVSTLGREVGGLKGIIYLGWASHEQLVERFRETAHYHRHHEHAAPPNPMTEGEGREFVLGLLRRWIDWERSGRKR